jgi:hypothetical protein
MDRQVRIVLWCIGGGLGALILAYSLIAAFSDSTREMSSYCTRCHVVQYRRYYRFSAFGTTWKLPAGLDVAGNVGDNSCPHQIVQVAPPLY